MSVNLQRARPWLGTLVEVRVQAPDDACARRAIEAAFGEVQAVHRCMSFHEADSDLSRLHAAPLGNAVVVDARTIEVLRCALDLAESSQGLFDVGIGGLLVEYGVLPRPVSPFVPDPQANWRDIELIGDDRVCLHRPLWLDLGGIAKGYAVDRAVAALRAQGIEQGVVNAGGDLRCFGGNAERVLLQHLGGAGQPLIELADAAVATSVVDATRARAGRRVPGMHANARLRCPVRAHRAVSVVASSCLVADALTKLVLADVRVATRLLRRHAASACLRDGRRGWRVLGQA